MQQRLGPEQATVVSHRALRTVADRDLLFIVGDARLFQRNTGTRIVDSSDTGRLRRTPGRTENSMSITQAQFTGAISLIGGVGLGASTVYLAATKDVSTKRTVQLGSGAIGLAGLGAGLLLPNSSKLMLPALGVGALGLATSWGLGFKSE